MEALHEEATSSEGAHQLLFQGPVELTRGWRRKARHLFLFQDFLVISKHQHKKSFKMKHAIPLSALWIDDHVDALEEGERPASKSILLGWAKEGFLATFPSLKQKDRWCSLLQRYIDQEKVKDKWKCVSIQIFTKDISTCGSGAETDYQLWFSCDQSQPSYPLLGHEHPYDIKMRMSAFKPKGLRDYISLSMLQRLYVKKLSPNKQGSFILKLSNPVREQHQSNAEEKTAKQRRSFMHRVFRSISRPRQHESPTAQPVQKTEKPFGKLLSDVCEEDSLPVPILEFPGNIQRSVLPSALYDKWLGVLDQVSEEERISAIRSILEEMPKPNVGMLRSLFALLQFESRHSTNPMAAYNLSVCMAPSILWLPTSGKTDLENELPKKISLVQFILENCQKIFGEDITSLWDNISVSGSEGEEVPGTLDESTDFDEMKVAKDEEPDCPSEETCLEGDDAEPWSPPAPLSVEETCLEGDDAEPWSPPAPLSVEDSQ